MKRFSWQPDEIVYIYALYETGQRERVYRYVGRTTDPVARLQRHNSSYNNRITKGSPVANWIQEVRKRGGTIGLEVIEELVNPTRMEASIAERNWVMALGELATNSSMNRQDHYETQITLSRTTRVTTADAANQNQND
jgi:hypothetical protein